MDVQETSVRESEERAGESCEGHRSMIQVSYEDSPSCGGIPKPLLAIKRVSCIPGIALHLVITPSPSSSHSLTVLLMSTPQLAPGMC
jgi:hypothetical protein